MMDKTAAALYLFLRGDPNMRVLLNSQLKDQCGDNCYSCKFSRTPRDMAMRGAVRCTIKNCGVDLDYSCGDYKWKPPLDSSD